MGKEVLVDFVSGQSLRRASVIVLLSGGALVSCGWERGDAPCGEGGGAAPSLRAVPPRLKRSWVVWPLGINALEQIGPRQALAIARAGRRTALVLEAVDDSRMAVVPEFDQEWSLSQDRFAIEFFAAAAAQGSDGFMPSSLPEALDSLWSVGSRDAVYGYLVCVGVLDRSGLVAPGFVERARQRVYRWTVLEGVRYVFEGGGDVGARCRDALLMVRVSHAVLMHPDGVLSLEGDLVEEVGAMSADVSGHVHCLVAGVQKGGLAR